MQNLWLAISFSSNVERESLTYFDEVGPLCLGMLACLARGDGRRWLLKRSEQVGVGCCRG